MAKTPAKKSAPKKAKARKATTKAPVAALADGEEAPFPIEKPAKRKKAAKAATPKAAIVDNRIITMHGETRLIHRGEGEAALAALLPMVDAIHASGKVKITSIAHSDAGATLHAVPTGHPEPYDANPGIVLTIGGNGLAAFDHIGIGLATPDLVEEVTIAIFAAMSPDEGEAPATVGRRKDWLEMAYIAAEEASSRSA